MPRYPKDVIQKTRELRATGKTYSEIRQIVGLPIPKNTFSDWCKNVALPNDYQTRIDSLNLKNLGKARAIAAVTNRIKREAFFKNLEAINLPLAKQISDPVTAKIALAMLCLGEASKYKSKSTNFSLGNSDPRIIILFLQLMRFCFEFDISKVRCTVQCRADQDIAFLEKYWQKITNIPHKYFYKALIDHRTIGKPTLKKDYMGVLKVTYLNRKIQLELESLAQLIYNQILPGP